MTFWFSNHPDDAAVAEAQAGLWWGHDPAVDADLAERFGPATEAAARGDLDGWRLTLRGRLALILLLDQLPRAIYRGTPQAFATDSRARELVLKSLDAGVDRGLRPIERVFMLMPLEHAEVLACQDLSVMRFHALASEVPDRWRPTFQGYLDFALRHREIIARFGRFPHRNAILGRRSTTAERAFLEQPGSSF